MINGPSLIAMTAFFNAYAQADIFGKFIFWFLFILSITSWVVLIHKIKLASKLKKMSVGIVSFFDKNKEKLLHLNVNNKLYNLHPYINLYRIMKDQTLEVLNKNKYFSQNRGSDTVYLSQADIEMIGSRVETAILQETKTFEKNMFVLSTIVTLAPFLGLLGTVWGILVTFSELQTHTIGSGNSSVLAGLSMALATTVIGLVVAIPALIAYNYLKNASKNFHGDMEEFSHSLLAKIELQYRTVQDHCHE
jgi:biopolymer transport protein TolQ